MVYRVLRDILPIFLDYMLLLKQFQSTDPYDANIQIMALPILLMMMMMMMIVLLGAGEK